MKPCSQSFLKVAALVCVFVLGLSGATPNHTKAQEPNTDTFVDQLLGEWHGSGEYQGNTLTLTRSWELVLRERFLRADMKVSMPNGFTFGALMYWKLTDGNVYDIVWMDGTGRQQVLRGTHDAVSGSVSATYLDEYAENGPEWRTWEFRMTGPDSYVERLYKLGTEGREELTVFRFTRSEDR